jgi:hypothetical protein
VADAVDGKGSRHPRSDNNREFLEFFSEKQASDELLAAASSKFDHSLSRLDPYPSRFLLLRKTGDLSVKTGRLNRNIRGLQPANR